MDQHSTECWQTFITTQGKINKRRYSSVLKGLNRNPNILLFLIIHPTLQCLKTKSKVWHRKYTHLFSTHQKTQLLLKSEVSNLVNNWRAFCLKKEPLPPWIIWLNMTKLSSQKLHWEYSVRAQMVPVLLKKKHTKTNQLWSQISLCRRVINISLTYKWGCL